MKPYDLVFTNAAVGFPRYKRYHDSIQSAQREVALVYDRIIDVFGVGSDVLAYGGNPVIYGPSCGPDGMPVKWNIEVESAQ